jgi:hypothetical protein
MDFATLYAEDVETWAELQVDALRRLAATPGSWANIIDWENVLEEIESLGSEQRRAVESLLENALAHALKVVGDPNSLSTERWKKEIVNFLRQARKKIKPASDLGSTSKRFGRTLANRRRTLSKHLIAPCLMCRSAVRFHSMTFSMPTSTHSAIFGFSRSKECRGNEVPLRH